MRFNPFVVLVAALIAYVGLRLLSPFPVAAQLAGAAFLAGVFWLLPKGWTVPQAKHPLAVLAPWIAMGFFSWLLVLTVVRDLTVAALALVGTPETLDGWIRASALGVMALTPAIKSKPFVIVSKKWPNGACCSRPMCSDGGCR